MKIALRHLRLLEVVARRGSIHAAARELDTEHTTVSRQLSRLEAALGGELVERGPHGTRLTSLGGEALDRARRILSELDDLAALNPAAEAATPAVRLAGPVVGAAAAGWRRRGYAVETTPAAGPEAYRLLREGRVDLAIAYEDPRAAAQPPPVGHAVLRRSVPLAAALPARHRRARASVLQLPELAREPWLLEGSGDVRSVTTAACEVAGFCPLPVLAGDATLVLSAVRAGAGVTLCPPSYLPAQQQAIALVPLEPAVWLWEVVVWPVGLGPAELVRAATSPAAPWPPDPD